MKLTNEDVVAIRSMAGSSAEIAAEFGVSRSHVKSIRNGASRMSVLGYVRPKMAEHMRGSDVTGSKLTAGDVLMIRSSTMSNVELAEIYGVTRQTIWGVRKGLTWRVAHMSVAIPACFGGRKINSPVEREALFWSKVDVRKPNQCWLWTGFTDRDGYGKFNVGGRMVIAHRFAYVLAFGRIPEGLCVMHAVCDRTACVNPNHLKVGTNAANMADRNNKNRQARGTKHGRAVLTEDQVHEIRASTELQTEIAERFGISKQHVILIKSRKRWGHLLDTKHMSEAIPACFSLKSTLVRRHVLIFG